MDAEVTLPYTVPAELVGRHFVTLSPDEWHAVRQHQFDHNLCWICGRDHDYPDDYGYYGSFYLPCTGPVDKHPSFRNHACAKAGEVPDDLVGTLYVHMNNSQLREVYWHRMNTGRCLSCGTDDHLINDCTPDTRTEYFRKKHGFCETCGEIHLTLDCPVVTPAEAASSRAPLEDSKSCEIEHTVVPATLAPADASSKADVKGPLSHLPAEIQFNIMTFASQQDGEIMLHSKSLPKLLIVPGIASADSLAAYLSSNAFRILDPAAACYMLNLLSKWHVQHSVKVLHFTSYGTRVTGKDLWSTDVREPEFMLVQKCENLTKIKFTIHSHQICVSRNGRNWLNDKGPADRIASVAKLQCYLDIVRLKKLKAVTFRGVKSLGYEKDAISNFEDDLKLLVQWMKDEFTKRNMKVCTFSLYLSI